MSDRKRLAPMIALAAALVMVGLMWVLIGGGDVQSGPTETFLQNKPAPGVVSTTLDGQPFDLSRRKGSWVVFNFFDSTCGPCRAEHPELIAFNDQQRALGVEGAELYTVINRDSNESVRDFFEANGGDWPIVRDDNGSIGVSFGVVKVPETWVIDPNGVVVVRFAGPITANELGITLQKLRDLSGL